MIIASEITVKLGNNNVLNCVSLEIQTGEFISIIGKNGSGKTSLARCLNGLLQPNAGTVRIGDLDTSHPKHLTEIHRRVGMVFQNPEDQLVATTVETELAFGLENLGLPTHEIHKRIEIAIDVFNLKNLRDRPPQQLSGGEKQRLAIASSYVMYPDFLILDEPTALLDNQHQNQLMNQLRLLNLEFGIGIILITHTPHEAAQTERIIILENGNIIGNASPKKIYNDFDLLKASEIEAPFPTQLGHALKEKNTALTIEDFADNWNKPIASRSSPPTPSIEKSSDTISIELKNIHHKYEQFTPDSKPSLNNVSMKFSRGSLHALLGKGGSGKTTLAQHLNRLLSPESGAIFINKENILKYPTSTLVGKVGLVFQFPELQLFAETVEEDVAFGPKKLRLCPEEIHRRVEKSLLQVNLSLKLYGKRSPQDLSSGEKRRVAIAGVIAMDPETIVLDEPTAGLDPITSKSLCKMMHALANKYKKSIIWITHDVDAAASWADKMTVLAYGKVALSGKTRDVLSNNIFRKSTELLPPSSVILYEKMKDRGYLMPYVPITLDETISLLSLKT
ncbi:MAG: energy-coupling factor transporter ATPase [Candidatus Latescibacterota bacterium]|nr:energy-coupling factor transporter ATPase [Candidatus Latescibacterota bacterium]